MRKILSILIILSFMVTNGLGNYRAFAQDLSLPVPGTMVNLGPAFEPVLIKGLKVHPENPFLFDFIIDTGNSALQAQDSQLKEESNNLIKYFLTALTVPEKDLWVNLSPYEKDRMIAPNLGQTEMGRDMLAQDYILKQLTASLIYPERDLGKAFWDEVYAKARQQYGTTQIPVNTFNKVWIVADKADVFERGNVAYVVGAHLKVMLEEDYLSLKNHAGISTETNSHTIASQVIRHIILPQIEKEVNQGKNFASLRQMFYSMILASWYKTALKEAILTQIYGNQSKVKVGVNQEDTKTNEEIFQRYLKAYKKGVFNYIKDDIADTQPVPRKYFSGGEKVWGGRLDHAQIVHSIPPGTRFPDRAVIARVNTFPQHAIHGDAAMHSVYREATEPEKQENSNKHVLFIGPDTSMQQEFTKRGYQVKQISNVGDLGDQDKGNPFVSVFISGVDKEEAKNIRIKLIEEKLTGMAQVFFSRGSSYYAWDFSRGKDSPNKEIKTERWASDPIASDGRDLTTYWNYFELVTNLAPIIAKVGQHHVLITEDEIDDNMSFEQAVKTSMYPTDKVHYAQNAQDAYRILRGYVAKASFLIDKYKKPIPSGEAILKKLIEKKVVKQFSAEEAPGEDPSEDVKLDSSDVKVDLDVHIKEETDAMLKEIVNEDVSQLLAILEENQNDTNIPLIKFINKMGPGAKAIVDNLVQNQIFKDVPSGKVKVSRYVSIAQMRGVDRLEGIAHESYDEVFTMMDEARPKGEEIEESKIQSRILAQFLEKGFLLKVESTEVTVNIEKLARLEQEIEDVQTKMVSDDMHKIVADVLYPARHLQKEGIGLDFSDNNFPISSTVGVREKSGVPIVTYAIKHLLAAAAIVHSTNGTDLGAMPFPHGASFCDKNSAANLLTIILMGAMSDDVVMAVASKKVDLATMAATPTGGIDFNRSNMQMNVHRQGAGVQMRFDPAMIARIRREGFDGLDFQIQSIMPLANIPAFLDKG